MLVSSQFVLENSLNKIEINIKWLQLQCFMTCVGLYELWKTGRYKSYPPNTLVDLIARILALVPPWTRVYRVQR